MTNFVDKEEGEQEEEEKWRRGGRRKGRRTLVQLSLRTQKQE